MSGTQLGPLAGIKVIAWDPRRNRKPPANPSKMSPLGRSAATRAAHHLFEKVYLSEDAQEGPRSFREKRKPFWKGR